MRTIRPAGSAAARWLRGDRLRRPFRGHRGLERLARAALVEAERRVLVAHQQDVPRDPRNPAVEPKHEVEELRRIARGEQKRDAGEQDENTDQPRLEAEAPHPVVDLRGCVASSAQQDPDDDVVGDREQPPLHEHEPARQPLRVLDVEPSGIVGYVVERERWVPVGAERSVRVEGDTPRPAEHSEVEVEDAARVATRDEDREERDDRQHQEGEPEEREHDVVRDREQPLHEPEPAAHVRVELALDAHRVGVRLDGLHSVTHRVSVPSAVPRCRDGRLPRG